MMKNQIIYPSIVKMPSLDAKVMQEEIFGPILPVLIVDNLTMVKTLINARP